MNKSEYIRILMLLSQLEGYIAGKVSGHILPDYMSDELVGISKLLAEYISNDIQYKKELDNLASTIEFKGEEHD